MKGIFELTRREQRIVILIVVVLVAIAFATHWVETKSRSPSERAISAPTASPAIPRDEDGREQNDSR